MSFFGRPRAPVFSQLDVTNGHNNLEIASMGHSERLSREESVLWQLAALYENQFPSLGMQECGRVNAIERPSKATLKYLSVAPDVSPDTSTAAIRCVEIKHSRRSRAAEDRR